MRYERGMVKTRSRPSAHASQMGENILPRDFKNFEKYYTRVRTLDRLKSNNRNGFQSVSSEEWNLNKEFERLLRGLLQLVQCTRDSVTHLLINLINLNIFVSKLFNCNN